MSVAADSKVITIQGPRKPQLSILVTTPQGVPIEGATVEVGSIVWELTPWRPGIFTKTTDADGKVSLDGMLPGGYLIQAYDEELHVQATPAGVNIDLLGKASPDSLTMSMHAAPWYYTLKITYPEVIGVVPATIMGKMLEIEKQFAEARFDEVRVKGSAVEIDFHIVSASPFVITGSIILAIFAGIALLIIIGVIAWILTERYVAPEQKGADEFIAPDGSTHKDQAALAQYLISQKDPKPWQCAYVGCNLRFATEGEKIAHMEQFHKVEKIPVVEIVAIIAVAAVSTIVLSKLLGGPVVLPAETRLEEARRRRAEEEQRRLEEERRKAASPGR